LAEPREFIDLSTGITKVPIENSQEAPRVPARARHAEDVTFPQFATRERIAPNFPLSRAARVSGEPCHRSFHRNAPFRARGTSGWNTSRSCYRNDSLSRAPRNFPFGRSRNIFHAEPRSIFSSTFDACIFRVFRESHRAKMGTRAIFSCHEKRADPRNHDLFFKYSYSIVSN